MPWIRLLSRIFALALAIAFCLWWSIVFTRGAHGLSSLWLASGVLCGFLLTSRRKQWLPYLLAAFVASIAVNFLCKGVDSRSVLLSFANTLDAWIVAVLVVRYAGHGPFFDPWINDVQSTLMLQGFIAGVCLLAFLVAAVLAERRLLVRRLVENERDYRILADHSHELIVRMGADGLRRYTSPSATQLLGWPLNELGNPRWDQVHPDEIDGFRQTLKDVFSDGETRMFTVRLRHADGHDVWMELFISRVPGMRTGDPYEVIYAGRDITEREQSRQLLAQLARHDTLTGLGNRMYFDERLELAVTRSHRHGKKLAVLYIDIDRFKQINDTYGHAVGDAILVGFAARLRSRVRATDFPARLGGDEFVVLVEDIDAPEAPRAIAEKLIASLHQEIVSGDVRVRVSASIGIAESIATDHDADALLWRADVALYAAKSAGRNTWSAA